VPIDRTILNNELGKMGKNVGFQELKTSVKEEVKNLSNLKQEGHPLNHNPQYLSNYLSPDNHVSSTEELKLFNINLVC
jgi:hypothetical protein